MILGAGLSGLAAGRRAIESGFQVTVYERMDQLGGLWYYTEDPDHVCVYDGILTNQPKEINELPDFSFSNKDQWYFSAKEVQEYFMAYAEKFAVDSVIRFNHEVVDISPAKKLDKDWRVTVKDRQTNTVEVKYFDFVIICNGHYSLPNVVDVKGQERFRGEQIHSVKYRNAEPYRGKSVLVVGSGLSALDITMLLAKVCSRVHFAQRTYFDLTFEKPANMFIHAVVEEITETGAKFVDGTSCEGIDTIIYATGYKYNFPFLNEKCGIKIEEEQIQHLYKHCINIEYPSMAIIGMPFLALTMQLFDLQSQFVMKYWTGQKQFPDKEEMLRYVREELEKRLALSWPKRYAHKMGELSREHHNDLSDTAGLERTRSVFYKIARYYGPLSAKDFLNYRGECYEIIDDETFRTFWKEEA